MGAEQTRRTLNQLDRELADLEKSSLMKPKKRLIKLRRLTMHKKV